METWNEALDRYDKMYDHKLKFWNGKDVLRLCKDKGKLCVHAGVWNTCADKPCEKGEKMTKSEVVSHLLKQMTDLDPKNEALKLAIISVLGEKSKTADKASANAEPTDKVKRKRGRKPFDIGKAQACRDAGWSMAKIADEMNVSEQTVRNRLAEVSVPDAV